METPTDGSSTDASTETLPGPPPVAWAAVDSPNRPRDPDAKAHRKRSRFRRIVSLPVRFPRVTVEAVLLTASLALAFWYLPNTSAAKPESMSAVQQIALIRPANIPSYVLDNAPYPGSPQDEVVLGMDVPAGSKPVSWDLVIFYPDQDQMVDRGVNNGDVHFGYVATSKDLGDPGYQGIDITGTMPAGSNSYSEFKDGYSATQAKVGLNGGSDTTPKDDVDFFFTIKGPVQPTDIQGATMAVNLPGIYVGSNDQTAKQAPAAFVSEDYYNGGIYQNLTGGPTIQGGTNWDWLNTGPTAAVSATGVDPAGQQDANNQFFLAAVLFGLAAAAGAALAVELVEAVQDSRRERKLATGEAAGSPAPDNPVPVV